MDSARVPVYLCEKMGSCCCYWCESFPGVVIVMGELLEKNKFDKKLRERAKLVHRLA